MLGTASATSRERIPQLEVHGMGPSAGCRGMYLLGLLQGIVMFSLIAESKILWAHKASLFASASSH